MSVHAVDRLFRISNRGCFDQCSIDALCGAGLWGEVDEARSEIARAKNISRLSITVDEINPKEGPC